VLLTGLHFLQCPEYRVSCVSMFLSFMFKLFSLILYAYCHVLGMTIDEFCIDDRILLQLVSTI
jgi:hypothetical protein